MLLNILITLFLLGLCLGEKKETVSSISSHRDDVPLPYSSHYDYPRNYNNQKLIDYFRSRPNILKSIQYAPLKPDDVTVSYNQDVTNRTRNVNLEPKINVKSKDNSLDSQANFLRYIEGHNIEVPPRRHKDTEYDPDVMTEKNKQFEQLEYDISLWKLKQKKQESQSNVLSLYAATTAETDTDINKQQTLPTNDNPTKSYLSALGDSKLEPVFNPYVKVPRLHLNIARSYNFARPPSKASLVGFQKIINIPKQSFLPNIDLLQHKKTFLYPVNNNKFTLRT